MLAAFAGIGPVHRRRRARDRDGALRQAETGLSADRLFVAVLGCSVIMAEPSEMDRSQVRKRDRSRRGRGQPLDPRKGIMPITTLPDPVARLLELPGHRLLGLPHDRRLVLPAGQLELEIHREGWWMRAPARAGRYQPTHAAPELNERWFR